MWRKRRFPKPSVRVMPNTWHGRNGWCRGYIRRKWRVDELGRKVEGGRLEVPRKQICDRRSGLPPRGTSMIGSVRTGQILSKCLRRDVFILVRAVTYIGDAVAASLCRGASLFI